MSEQIVRHEAELIPSSELPKFEQAIGELQTIGDKLPALKDEARDLEVNDAITFARGKAILAELKGNDKETDAVMAPYDTILDRVRNFIKTKKLVNKNAAETIRFILTPKLDAWARKDEADRKADEQRKQREVNERNAKAAEEKRLALEAEATERREKRVAEIRAELKAKKITLRQSKKLLEDAGATEEAAKAEAAAIAEEQKANPPKVTVESTIPKMKGRPNRTNYYAKCVDKKAFLLAFVKEVNEKGDFGDMLEFVTVSDQKLSEKATEVKDSIAMGKLYPGIEATDNNTF